MESGDVQRKVIRDPENWEEIQKKYLEKQERQLKRKLTQHGVTSPEDLKTIAHEAIKVQKERAASEHKPLKDRTPVTEEKSPEIIALRAKLNEEISTFAKERLRQFGTRETPEDLKGRKFTQGGPEKSSKGVGNI